MGDDRVGDAAARRSALVHHEHTRPLGGFTPHRVERKRIQPPQIEHAYLDSVLTGEGGRSPSRFKLVVQQEGVYRRLTPVELERLNMFPDGWTAGMSDGRRAFMVGNALVVGIVERIGREIATRAAAGGQIARSA